MINSLAAIQAGADQVHGSALGMGERVGNTPLDQLLVNLKLLGWIDNDLSRLGEYCETAARACNWTVPLNYPVFGRDAFPNGDGRSCCGCDQELQERRSASGGHCLLRRSRR